MPFRLARALRAQFASTARKHDRRATSRCAAEWLEDRRLLTVSILTPYQHDVEGNTAAFVADFTAPARPGDANVSGATAPSSSSKAG